ncbi:MAG: hypothetical protein JEY97_02960 [Bacteroidales bacterium]|nr:hypothetical protein [Bacteroidales bacterium]
MKVTKSKIDYIITFITEFLLLCAGLLVYRFANVNFNNEGFAEYALFRRTLSFVQPILLLGLGVGLPRFVSISESKSNNREASTYFISATFILTSVLIIITPILLIFKQEFAWLLFGENKYSNFIPPLLVLIIGICFHSLAYSYLRGKLLMLHANSLQIINLGFILTLSFFISNSIIEVIYFTGFGWMFFSLAFLIPFWFKAKGIKELYIKKVRELLKYGIQRVPGDIGLAAMLTIPVLTTAHFSGIEAAGYLAFGISLLNMAGAVFSPISLILLPQASALFANKQFGLLRQKTIKILIITLIVSGIGLIVFELFAKGILEIYLSEINSSLIQTCMILISGCVGYCIYISLRSVLDACYIKAINTKNLIIVILLYLIFETINYLIFNNNITIHLVIISISFNLLGLLTLIEVFILFRKNNQNRAEN